MQTMPSERIVSGYKDTMGRLFTRANFLNMTEEHIQDLEQSLSIWITKRKATVHTLRVLANELMNHHITLGHRWTGKFGIFGGRSVPSENSSRHRSENNRRRPRSRKSRSKALGKSKRERSVPVLNGIRMGCNGATMVKGCLQTGYKISWRASSQRRW